MQIWSVLTVVFVVLKLVGTIDWSWWWVLSPMLALGALGVILGMGVYGADRAEAAAARRDIRAARKWARPAEDD